MELKKYDPEERIFILGKKVLMLCRKLPENTISRPLISQLVRSATSIGANYMEGNGAVSKKDLINKISIARKEAKETLYWVRLLAFLFVEKSNEFQLISQETQELVYIFSAIIKKIQTHILPLDSPIIFSYIEYIGNNYPWHIKKR